MVLAGAITGCGANVPPVAEAPPPPVTISQPVSQETRNYDPYEGRIKAVNTVDVKARVSGHLVKVNFQDGQIVNKDDILFEIDPRSYKATLDGAEAQKAAAEAAQKLANAEYDRTRKLVSSGAASREELDVWIAKKATAGADIQKADANIEQAKLDLDFTKVKAEISGKISRPLVTVGNVVTPILTLATIVTVDPMYVYFDVDEYSLLRYRKDDRKHNDSQGKEPSLKDLKIPVEVALEGETGYPHVGLLDYADNRVNQSTGTIEVRGVLDNPKRLFDDGLRARVRVPIDDPYKALMISERAIGTEQGRKFVYVVNAQDIVERRDVTLGRVDNGLQVIEAGLKPDDWVIVNGIQRVRDGMKVKPQRRRDEG